MEFGSRMDLVISYLNGEFGIDNVNPLGLEFKEFHGPKIKWEYNYFCTPGGNWWGEVEIEAKLFAGCDFDESVDFVPVDIDRVDAKYGYIEMNVWQKNGSCYGIFYQPVFIWQGDGEY